MVYWIIVEEILRSNVAHWLSPNGRLLAYIQFNDTHVPRQAFHVFGDSSDLYDRITEIPYPKVHIWSVHVQDISFVSTLSLFIMSLTIF